jgi:hypothetical protein
MPQPPKYQRTKDFTVDYGDNTDHNALNAELDSAAASINAIRTNLALLQRDDGKLKQGVVTADSVSQDFLDEISADVVTEVQGYASDAQASAVSANAAAATSVSASNTAVTARDTAVTSSNTAALASQSAAASAAAAQTSQTDAAASKAAAAASQGAAGTSATNAAASATAAGNSATTATTQAGIATTKAGEASASAASAAASLNDLKGRYYGPLASDPTLDPNGNPVDNGDLYANTTTGELRRYNGTAWVTAFGGIPNDGTVTMSKLAADVTAKLGKNRIINGNFRINQRAVAGTVTLPAGTYGHDRFKAGAAGCTYTFVASGSSVVITITAGSLMQVIEDVNIEGGAYALSHEGTANARMAINGAATSGAYAPATKASPLTTAVANANQSITVEFSTGTVSRVQLEPGLAATGYDFRPPPYELWLAQRYVEYVNITNTVAGVYASGFCAVAHVSFKNTKRTTPSAAITTAPTGTGIANIGFSGNAYPSLDQCGFAFTTTSPVGTNGFVSFAAAFSSEI